MGPKIRLLDEPARRKHGRCKLCGSVGPLSRTHVPAQGAGNKGTARRPIEVLGNDGTRRYGLARETEGGMWGRWFCEPCNNATGRWDEEYIRWVEDVFPALHDPRSVGNRFWGRSDRLCPGAFVRCLWAWMFALADHLFDRHGDLAAAVRHGDPVEPPAGVRLLLAATRDLQFAIFALSFSVNVTAPPFVASLVRTGFESEFPTFFDTGPWLCLPTDKPHSFELEIPIVHTFDEVDFPPVGQPVID